MNIIVPATSANLGPGFDALGLSVSLYNEVSIQSAKFSSVSINGEGSENVNLKRNNLFISIFNEIFTELTGENENFRVVFDNKIPFSRGLGSSSAVIVGAIASAYVMAGFKADRQVVLNRALTYENHPDNITPATLGGFISAVVDSGRVYANKFEVDDSLKAVVVIPNVAMNTNQSRSVLPKNYTIKECVNNLSHAAFLTSCFCSKRYDLLKIACKDMMHEERRMSALDELFEVRKLAYENGALMSSLSGSGSSFLNIVYANDAQNFRNKLAGKFNKFRVEIFSFDNDGFQIIQS
ncbi:homoserine kinase [Campylobacter sp. RM9344]|uniref:Homoserine kinase n=1 Tax=Campylobacter californiensis TaxID=1032243 RepID=A0AAW3ZTX5_9BACT|nr:MULTISPECIES: homoserine kinase [unclassified Campylobacter]MBE2984387.1 homoserine kinase [Campylobacter sp. RM6883]MBE2995822.1 homoserine kinase [Campylobacter sp. RM6913]MBE3029653.1 homoserine kinase [Campylobacter sp. RM9344]MBE3607138.1 homoserine kinase [Campylobacter sp. RM9337]QCD50263.1 homoserine kinase [Campylobacter sp. RM6914]